MKLLRDILYKVGIVNVVGKTNVAIENICFDSRKIGKLSAFIAVNGTLVNGHDFIETAIASGASAIICEELPEQLIDHDLRYSGKK